MASSSRVRMQIKYNQIQDMKNSTYQVLNSLNMHTLKLLHSKHNGLSLSMTRAIGIMVLMVVAYQTAHSFSLIYCNPFQMLRLRSHLCGP